MKQQIYDTILSILAEKRADGDVLPYATSVEVAHRLKMNALDVEEIAKGIEGIVKGRTLNYEWYHGRVDAKRIIHPSERISGKTHNRVGEDVEKVSTFYLNESQ